MLNSSISNSELSIRVSSVTLSMLDEKARNIIRDLLDVTHPERKKLNGLTSEEIEEEIKRFFKNMSGRFIRFHNVGHIPCLRVRAGNKSEVGTGKGFELKRAEGNRSRTVERINDDFSNYPVRVYANGEIQAAYSGQERLEQILEKAEGQEKLLLSQHITWIHKEYNIYDRNYASYIIDVADERIYRNPKTYFKSEIELDETAGEKRTSIKHCSCEKEDFWLLVSRMSCLDLREEPRKL